MIRAEQAIASFRRGLAASWAVKAVLIAGAVGSLLAEALFRPVISGPVLLALVGAAWIILSYRSVKGSRMVAQSPLLIAAGQYEQAERQIGEALGAFSMFRVIRLRSLHALALLRHAQKRWGDAAILCRALLGESLASLPAMKRSAQLMLADALLEVGDLGGAYEAIGGLYQQRLSLPEAVELNRLQTDYLTRVDGWGEIFAGIRQKAEMAELLPPAKSARCQAMLALAAKRLGKDDWHNFLLRRAELIGDMPALVSQRPLLSELWPGAGGEPASMEPKHDPE